MSKNNKLAEMMRRKNELASKVKALKEAKNQPQFNTGVAFLIESELEKAEVLLAAKSVVEKLQKMAEDLAKVNGDDIMPLMEPLKSAFGPQMADTFQATAAEHINQLTASVTSAKDAISAEVSKFEGIINGTNPGNDMAAAPAAAPAAPGGEGDFDFGDDEMGGDEMGTETTVSAGETDFADADGSKAEAGDFDMDDSFSPDDSLAAGRAKKESAAPRGRAIKEGEFVKAKKGENPFAKKDKDAKDEKKDDSEKEEVAESTDARILRAFRRQIREGVKPVAAAKRIAEHFKVDFSDVVEIVRESSLGK